jgi:hypothetical protein
LAHGLDKPTDQKAYLKMYKKGKYLVVHLDILCSLTKFCEKKIFSMDYVENIGAPKNCYLCDFLFCFTPVPKNVLPPQNFVGDIECLMCTQIFLSNVLTFSNAFKMQFS